MLGANHKLAHGKGFGAGGGDDVAGAGVDEDLVVMDGLVGVVASAVELELELPALGFGLDGVEVRAVAKDVDRDRSALLGHQVDELRVALAPHGLADEVALLGELKRGLGLLCTGRRRRRRGRRGGRDEATRGVDHADRGGRGVGRELCDLAADLEKDGADAVHEARLAAREALDGVRELDDLVDAGGADNPLVDVAEELLADLAALLAAADVIEIVRVDHANCVVELIGEAAAVVVPVEVLGFL
mmetsp:Transcript_22945/g.57014  ORF Transcript_22945/g.57014 Transcript_22945/m.57014 type:complete len:245 (-) Transcript_22945:383-1117(-)